MDGSEFAALAWLRSRRRPAAAWLAIATLAAAGHTCTPTAAEPAAEPPAVIGCGDSKTADVAKGTDGLLAASFLVPATGVVAVTFATCNSIDLSDNAIDTVLTVDGVVYNSSANDGSEACGRHGVPTPQNERVTIRVAGPYLRPGATMLVRVRFQDAIMDGTL